MSTESSKQALPSPSKEHATVELAHALRQLLQFHQTMGIMAYPASPALRQCLRRRTPPVNIPPVTRGPVQQAKSPLSVKPSQKSSADSPEPTKDISALKSELEGCSRCALAQKSLGRIPGRGGEHASLMVIGDFSLQTENFSREVCFGEAEDAMLFKMMQAIGLSSEDVYITNVVKCCPISGKEPVPNMGSACMAFLHEEIQAVRPRVICAMGEMAAHALLGTKAPIVRLRGRFHKYPPRGEKGILLPLMVTYHPRFLLVQQAMKKATWIDLQLIQGRLKKK